MLRDLLAEGKALATVHLLLGAQAALERQRDMAATHLDQACRVNQAMRGVLSWLIATLAEKTPSARDRALQLADAAIAAWPQDANLRAARERLLKQSDFY